jgi:hypothetical protein
LEEAMEFAALKVDEWGNSLPIAETKQREKVCDLIRRKMDKVRVAMGGAKFDTFRNCQKAIAKVTTKFEKQMKKVIKIAADRRASRMRAKKRLDLFDEEQEWYQKGSRYDDALTSTPEAMYVNKSLKPSVKTFDRPWIDGARSSFGWKRRVLKLVSIPFWEAEKKKILEYENMKQDEKNERIARQKVLKIK